VRAYSGAQSAHSNVVVGVTVSGMVGMAEVVVGTGANCRRTVLVD
jgi:hypothetical protein